MSQTRPYNSPLRDQQVQATRAQILDALIDVISEQGAQDLNIKDLADRAEVAERTVYRHFPDRAALLDGLYAHVEEHAQWTGPESYDSMDEVRDQVAESFANYDRLERETRALVLMNLDPARTAAGTREHVIEVERLTNQSFPHLDDDEVRGMAAVFGALVSSRTWLRMLDGNGLKGSESGPFIAWTIDLMIKELSSGARISPRTED